MRIAVPLQEMEEWMPFRDTFRLSDEDDSRIQESVFGLERSLVYP
ncbi:hypothetical protein [Coleofasciculus sp. FACHB-1120]|nr:hypothetical protein [Coleofasciculus sp. FACHB-1120]